MKVRLKIANVAKETGALLTRYLTERGLDIVDKPGITTICYGVPSTAKRCLNGECGGGDKIRRLTQMEEGGCRTIPWFSGDTGNRRPIPQGFVFPALARRISGHGGEDIVPVFQPEEIPWRLAAGWDWFSSYVPVQTEFRVWIFRDECLDMYEKVMHRPEDYKYIGRNFRNGFDFVPYLGPSGDAIRQAVLCIRALHFDFGAIDMLLGTDGLIYVLECNTAPGVIKSGAQQTLHKLADRMVGWVRDGTPRRNY